MIGGGWWGGFGMGEWMAIGNGFLVIIDRAERG
jgi:hypothetical protein